MYSVLYTFIQSHLYCSRVIAGGIWEPKIHDYERKLHTTYKLRCVRKIFFVRVLPASKSMQKPYSGVIGKVSLY